MALERLYLKTTVPNLAKWIMNKPRELGSRKLLWNWSMQTAGLEKKGTLGSTMSWKSLSFFSQPFQFSVGFMCSFQNFEGWNNILWLEGNLKDLFSHSFKGILVFLNEQSFLNRMLHLLSLSVALGQRNAVLSSLKETPGNSTRSVECQTCSAMNPSCFWRLATPNFMGQNWIWVQRRLQQSNLFVSVFTHPV